MVLNYKDYAAHETIPSYRTLLFSSHSSPDLEFLDFNLNIVINLPEYGGC